jgi:hypothetical protein
MPKEASTRLDGEPVLDARTAGIVLRMTGRAVEAGGRLFRTAVSMDSIGEAAFAIHKGEVEGTLSAAIEETTGAPSTLSPDVLTELVNQSLISHAVELGMSSEEAAAQIAG